MTTTANDLNKTLMTIAAVAAKPPRASARQKPLHESKRVRIATPSVRRRLRSPPSPPPLPPSPPPPPPRLVVAVARRSCKVSCRRRRAFCEGHERASGRVGADNNDDGEVLTFEIADEPIGSLIESFLLVVVVVIVLVAAAADTKRSNAARRSRSNLKPFVCARFKQNKKTLTFARRSQREHDAQGRKMSTRSHIC